MDFSGNYNYRITLLRDPFDYVLKLNERRLTDIEDGMINRIFRILNVNAGFNPIIITKIQISLTPIPNNPNEYHVKMFVLSEIGLNPVDFDYDLIQFYNFIKDNSTPIMRF